MYRSYSLAREDVLGVANQPKAEGDLVSTILDTEIERLADEMQRISHHVERRKPLDHEDREAKAEILIRWNLECGGYADLAAVVRDLQPEEVSP